MPHHDGNSISGFALRLARGARRKWAQRHESARPRGSASTGVPKGSPEPPLTTVDATIRREARAGYTRLVWAPGEPHLVREDLGARATAGRSDQRRSIVYLAHHTDTHVCDAQNPARLEPGERFAWFNPGADGGHRPQETCTAQVLDQVVRATNAVATSPLTGAAMAVCVQTGDNTDNRTAAETRWWIDVLAGRETTADTGRLGRYEGIQRSAARWSFQADDPAGTAHGRAGFPALPGFLDASLAPFRPAGLEVPWLAVMGNHDSVFLGTFGPMPGLRFDRFAELLTGAGRKPVSVPGMLAALAHATFLGIDPRRWDRHARRRGTQAVTADAPARAPLDLEAYLRALLDDGPGNDEAGDAGDAGHAGDRRPDGPPTGPGPAGHGFTEANLADGTGWWSRPQGDHVQLIGLDSCNHTRGSEGVMADAQYRWLEAELTRWHRRWLDEAGRWQEGEGPDRLCILFSHHNSWTMTNTGVDDRFPDTRHGGADVVALLQRFPNVVLWVNGHSHEHRIVAHPGPVDPVCGFWEVNTASCIDFGQQARTVEVVDNGDGTLSAFTTVLDHAAPPSVAIPDVDGWTAETLASVSRELSANDGFWYDPMALLGRPQDRNTELVLPAPFALPAAVALTVAADPVEPPP